MTTKGKSASPKRYLLWFAIPALFSRIQQEIAGELVTEVAMGQRLDSATHRGVALNVLRNLSLVALLGILAMTNAKADAEGFLDNWRGDIKIELRALTGSGPAVTFPVANAPESFSNQISRSWAMGQTQRRICDELRSRFQESGAFTQWLSCDVARTGELRGRIAGSNQLDLKYVVTGNRIRFKAPTPSGIPGSLDPTVQGDFDIELRLTITFDTSVDGRNIPTNFEVPPFPPAPPDPPNAGYLLKPAHLTDARILFAGARFSSQSILVDLFGEDKLRDAERKMNAASADFPRSNIDLREINRGLHRGANQLAALIRSVRPDLGIPTPLFDLLAFINAERAFTIQYQRFGNPPQIFPGCSCTEKCDDEVSCHCSDVTLIQENDHVFLHRLKPDATWTSVGVSDTDFISGSALGAKTGDTLTHRICRMNRFGSSCTPPFSFVYREVGACSPPVFVQPGSGTPRTCMPNCPK